MVEEASYLDLANLGEFHRVADNIGDHLAHLLSIAKIAGGDFVVMNNPEFKTLSLSGFALQVDHLVD